MENQEQLPWEIEKIIEVANCLASTGSSGASTGERIAAAFVLNRMEFLPASYRDAVEAGRQALQRAARNRSYYEDQLKKFEAALSY
mgnify:CR=1 FL=1